MQLHYKQYGEGEPLLILHGLFGSLDNWHTLARKFGENFAVYALDQRNHGKSPHAEEHTYAAMAEDLKAFSETHNLAPVNVIGHSMGGKTAMHFALKYPELVNKLIVVDMAPKKYEAGHDEILDALQSFPLDQVKNRSEADEALKQKIDNFGIRQFLLKNLERKGNDGYNWKMNLPVLVRDYEKILDHDLPDTTFHKPAIFIRGEASGYIKDADRPDIERYFPKAEIHTIEGAGHWIHAEAPEAFYNKVIDFLKTNTEAGG